MKVRFSITLALISPLAVAQNATLTKPDIHDDRIVFTAEGDLWLARLSDGVAQRLTSDPGVETNAKFSPDGKTIAFNAQYEGGVDLYAIDEVGSAPRRLTYFTGPAEMQGWSRDGNSIYFRSGARSPSGYEDQLFSVPVAGGQFRQLPVPRGAFVTAGPNGQLAYVPVSAEWMNWFRYKAGAADQLWWTDQKGKFKRLSSGPGIDTTPTWCGDDVYFVSERSGALNLWRRNMSTGVEEQVTRFADGGVRYPSSDGKRVIFQHGAGLALFDPATKKVKELDIHLVSDRIHARPFRVPLAPIAKDADFGPNAKRILYSARGQIVSAPVEQGDVRVLENTPGARATSPTYVSGGKQFAFVSDRSGENEIWVASAIDGSGARQITKGLKANPVVVQGSPAGDRVAVVDRAGRVLLVELKTGVIREVHHAPATGSYDDNGYQLEFSGDGAILAFNALEENFNFSGYVHDVAANKTARVTPEGIPIEAITVSPDGKYVSYLALIPTTFAFDDLASTHYYPAPYKVYMTSIAVGAPSPLALKNDEEAAPAPTTEKPAPNKYDLDGAVGRTFEVPIAPGRYKEIESVVGKLLVHVTDPATGVDRIDAFDFDKRTTTPFANGVRIHGRTPDAKKLLVQAGSTFGVLDANGGAPTFPNLAGVTLTIDPVKEWRQIFYETWRVARDFFYDPGMHGVDWEAMKRRYEVRLARVGDRSDLARLQKSLVSELNCGHAYVSDPSQPRLARAGMGYLGADYAAVPNSAAVKITKIYRANLWEIGQQSPLAAIGLDVKVGDYILAVGGQAVRADQDIQALLIGTAGRVITLLVNDKPNTVGARIIRVRPMADEHDLRYATWVQERADYVKKYGGDEFGYAHIADMENAGFNGFLRGQVASALKPAMIYDTRYNGGGNISSDLLRSISNKPTFWFKPRDGVSWTREGWATVGYSAAICNEFNFSDGELFIETWKRLNLGPVVGKRTGGGEVGSGNGYSLIDGGLVFVPNYAAYGEGKWIIEGYGATPTVEVDQDPTQEMAGRDPQLDRTIALLKDMLRKQPKSRPDHPSFPKKAN